MKKGVIQQLDNVVDPAAVVTGISLYLICWRADILVEVRKLQDSVFLLQDNEFVGGKLISFGDVVMRVGCKVTWIHGLYCAHKQHLLVTFYQQMDVW